VARVVLTTELSRRFTGGKTEIEVDAGSIRHVVRELEEAYPGLGKLIEEAGMIVAIDGELYHDPFLEPVGADSEVCFLPALGGGRSAVR